MILERSESATVLQAINLLSDSFRQALVEKDYLLAKMYFWRLRRVYMMAWDRGDLDLPEVTRVEIL